MMKKILAVALVVLSCLCFFSCDKDDAPDGMKNASNKSIVDYNLYVPESWVVTNADRGATQAYVSENDRTSVLVMQWNITENTRTVDDWWEKEYKPQVFEANAVQDYKITKEGEGVTLDKQPAKAYSYTGKIGDTYFKYDLVACVTRGSIYVMQFTYMQDTVAEGAEITYSGVEAHGDAVKSIVDNFKFN